MAASEVMGGVTHGPLAANPLTTCSEEDGPFVGVVPGGGGGTVMPAMTCGGLVFTTSALLVLATTSALLVLANLGGSGFLINSTFLLAELVRYRNMSRSKDLCRECLLVVGLPAGIVMPGKLKDLLTVVLLGERTDPELTLALHKNGVQMND